MKHKVEWIEHYELGYTRLITNYTSLSDLKQIMQQMSYMGIWPGVLQCFVFHVGSDIVYSRLPLAIHCGFQRQVSDSIWLFIISIFFFMGL